MLYLKRINYCFVRAPLFLLFFGSHGRGRVRILKYTHKRSRTHVRTRVVQKGFGFVVGELKLTRPSEIPSILVGFK